MNLGLRKKNVPSEHEKYIKFLTWYIVLNNRLRATMLGYIKKVLKHSNNNYHEKCRSEYIKSLLLRV